MKFKSRGGVSGAPQPKYSHCLPTFVHFNYVLGPIGSPRFTSQALQALVLNEELLPLKKNAPTYCCSPPANSSQLCSRRTSGVRLAALG